MGPMAIGTSGRLKVPQLISFAMIGFQVRTCKVGMALAALYGYFSHKFVLMDIRNGMRSMAGFTGGILFAFFAGFISMVTGNIFIVNTFMALATGSRNIPRIHR